MKKLTAGIFSVLMGLVSVNAAEAAVASKGYVDAKIGDTGNKTVVEMIQSVSTDSSDATEALAGRVDTVEGAIETLNGDESVPGSVAKKIADAITAEDLTNKFAAKEDVSNKASQVTEGMNKGQMYPTVALTESLIAGANQGMSNLIGDVADGKTVVEMITEGDSALETNLTKAITDGDTATLNAAKAYAEEKASAAQTAAEATAAADATAKANAAQAAAEATAAADATAKANAAQAAAEATAAADATAKADAAQAAAEATAAADATAKADAAQAAAEATAADALASAKTELQGYADTAEADAITKAGENADTKISNLNLAALSRVPVDCQDPDSFCVLTAKGGMFYWEAIERATGEAQPEGTAIPSVKQ